MRAKLIKVLEHYHLYYGDKAIATTIVGNPMLLPNLSLKNCQAVELGVDLDTLVLSFYPKTEWDVEIIMGDPIGIGDKYTPDTKPKLDADGCLILKRIKE